MKASILRMQYIHAQTVTRGTCRLIMSYIFGYAVDVILRLKTMRYLIHAHHSPGFVAACLIKYKSEQVYLNVYSIRGDHRGVLRQTGIEAIKKGARTIFVWNGSDICLIPHVPDSLRLYWFDMQRGQIYTWSQMMLIQTKWPDAVFVANQFIRETND